MQPDTAPWRLALRRLPATLTQLRLEIKIVTGGRAIVLLVVTALWFGLFTAWALMRDSPWPPEAFYNLMLVAPGSILIVALSMGAIVGERDTRQLETTFVSPTGRFGAWVHRLAAVLLAAWLSTGLLSVLTRLVVDPEHRPLAAWLHALVPLLFLLALTTLLALVFQSSAAAGLGAGALLVFSLVFQDLLVKWDYWFNPFAELRGIDDPQTLFRMIVFNRSLYLGLAGLLFALAFWLLQRRERLL